ncbi:MAG: thioredoxin-dependent thiol peroxidase [Bacteroidales bacterium]|jgi:peroxiredoxin Q/BCP|nr:thioredoxin-dependent thiol peroxidase [Bacteroidales bacterium]
MKTTFLKPGDTAPDFTAVDQDGVEFSLSEYQGRAVVLYFYPKDNTTGCTEEACSLRDGYTELKQLGLDVIGVSPDSTRSHRSFIQKHSLPFRLAADTDHRIAELYGVWAEKSMYGKTYMGIVRTTFIIKGDRKITHVFDKVNTKAHAMQILEELKKTL